MAAGIRPASRRRTRRDMDPIIWVPGGILLSIVVIAVIVMSLRRRR
jgi:hypothetical protein